jgi:hypothetical protein
MSCVRNREACSIATPRVVSQWQFEPAMDNGKAVSRQLTRRIEFALKAQ